MKNSIKILIVGIVLLQTISTLNGQIVLQEGVEWTYNYHRFVESGISFNNCFIEGDTLINQKQCFIYKREKLSCDFRPMREYIYEEDGKLFYYEFTLDKFRMLYDFSAEVGDTLTIEYWPDFSLDSDSLFYIRIDSIDNFQLGNNQLKQFNVSYDLWNDDEIEFSDTDEKQIIIEGIGSLTNFFHVYDNGWCDWHYNIGLRCFSYPGIETYQLSDIACDSVTNNYQPSFEKEVEIYPNPFVNTISLNTDFDINEAEIIICSINGQEVFRKRKEGKARLDMQIDLESYPKSMYFVAIYGKRNDGSKELIYRKKLVKN